MVKNLKPGKKVTLTGVLALLAAYYLSANGIIVEPGMIEPVIDPVADQVIVGVGALIGLFFNHKRKV